MFNDSTAHTHAICDKHDKFDNIVEQTNYKLTKSPSLVTPSKLTISNMHVNVSTVCSPLFTAGTLKMQDWKKQDWN